MALAGGRGSTQRIASPLDEPVAPVPSAWIALIALANLALLMAYFGPLGVLIPDQVQAAVGGAHKVVAFGWVTGLGALVAVVANPLAGALSDRTSSRFGRRHPWTLGGSLASAASLLLLAHQHTIAGIAVGWCLAQAGINAMQAGVAAGVPDRVPVAQRGVVSGWIGISQTVAAPLSVFLVSEVSSGNSGYSVLAVLVVVVALPFVISTSDVRLERADQTEFHLRAFLSTLWPSPALHPDFGWAWLTRFLMVLGNSMAVIYLLYFLRDRSDFRRYLPGQQASTALLILLGIYTLMVVASTVVSGRLSDRTGRRRRPVMISGIIMAVPAVMLGLSPRWPVMLVSAAILGIGFGIYLSVDLALVTQVLPSAAGRAKDLGMISVASSAGQALAPVLAAPLVTYLGGYSTLYLSVGGIFVLGAVTVLRVRSVP
jgi:MFS family permease